MNLMLLFFAKGVLLFSVEFGVVTVSAIKDFIFHVAVGERKCTVTGKFENKRLLVGHEMYTLRKGI